LKPTNRWIGESIDRVGGVGELWIGSGKRRKMRKKKRKKEGKRKGKKAGCCGNFLILNNRNLIAKSVKPASSLSKYTSSLREPNVTATCFACCCAQGSSW
jgi:hypothetical protein